jgi:hypothetical protein
MNRFLAMTAALGAAGVFAAGCGSSAVSCLGRSMGTKVSCVEIDNPPGGAGDQARTDCANQHGTYSDGPCDHTGVIGGCRLSFPGVSFSTTTWFYPIGTIKTAADVMQQCKAQSNATFVAP